jgi:membrane protease YdiL (CAAX protease family)
MVLMVIYHHPDSVSDASSGVATSLSLGAATLLFFVESLFGPLMEELCFRGVLYRGLRASWGILPSLIVSSLWFAVLHNEFAPWLLFHKFAVGAVNALLYEKTKSLVPSVIAHCLNNIFLNFA